MPRAAITLDGHPLLRQPHPVDPGSEVTVAARHAGYRDARRVVHPPEAGPFDVSLELEPETGSAIVETPPERVRPAPPPPAFRPPAWSPFVAVGLAALAAGAGAFFGVQTLDRDRADSDLDASATGATVSFTVAGAAAASGVGLWIWRQ